MFLSTFSMNLELSDIDFGQNFIPLNFWTKFFPIARSSESLQRHFYCIKGEAIGLRSFLNYTGNSVDLQL